MIHTDDMVATVQDEFRIVSDHEKGLTALRKRLERCGNSKHLAVIKAARRFIEYDQVAIRANPACNSDTLFLPA